MRGGCKRETRLQSLGDGSGVGRERERDRQTDGRQGDKLRGSNFPAR